MENIYHFWANDQRHDSDLARCRDDTYEGTLRTTSEYEPAECTSCGKFNLEKVAKIDIPSEFKVRVRSGTDLFMTTQAGFTCVSTRMKDFLFSIDDSLQFKPFPNDEFHLVCPTYFAEWDINEARLRFPKKCETCGSQTGLGIVTLEGLIFENEETKNRIFRLQPELHYHYLYCCDEIKSQVESMNFNGFFFLELQSLSDLD